MSKTYGLITVREAASILRIDEHSVRRAIWRGALRGRKRGGRWLLSRSEVTRE